MDGSASERRGLVARVRSRPGLSIGIAVVALLAVVVVLWWFQPQALLFDRVVDEDFPAVADAPDPEPADDDTQPAEASEVDPDPDGADDPDADDVADDEDDLPAEPVELASGTFESRNRYTVTGGAAVFELPDGSRTLRLEPFESTNGPDLYVYLTAADHADSDDQLDADFVDLGDLRGNIGNQNYDIPSEVDLAVYDTVVIWCRRFTTSFGAADLH
jgi:hypothetical protein